MCSMHGLKHCPELYIFLVLSQGFRVYAQYAPVGFYSTPRHALDKGPCFRDNRVSPMKLFLRYFAYVLILFFTLVGIAFTGVYVAMQFGLLNVRGTIDERNEFFLDAFREQTASSTETVIDTSLATTTPSVVAPTKEVLSMPDTPCMDSTQTTCMWSETPEWAVIRSALSKDASVLMRVAEETGVPARMIASVVFPEQARFFTSNREVFKRWFEPMKLLGTLTQFSLGVSGIKQETAKRVEEYARDPASPFYPGPGIDVLVAYPTGADTDAERFKRLTDEKDHYYSYLYTALFIKEVEAQWQRAGYDVSDNPEVVVTLFNLGFDKSLPNPSPSAGGAPITLGNTTYSYGSLGALFYHSEELMSEFPKVR
jgi:hypothetical protein